jgi:hypothetical protein
MDAGQQGGYTRRRPARTLADVSGADIFLGLSAPAC